eukprot:365948-Chlamydomonas_euryale.AAC.20
MPPPPRQLRQHRAELRVCASAAAFDGGVRGGAALQRPQRCRLRGCAVRHAAWRTPRGAATRPPTSSEAAPPRPLIPPRARRGQLLGEGHNCHGVVAAIGRDIGPWGRRFFEGRKLGFAYDARFSRRVGGPRGGQGGVPPVHGAVPAATPGKNGSLCWPAGPWERGRGQSWCNEHILTRQLCPEWKLSMQQQQLPVTPRPLQEQQQQQ